MDASKLVDDALAKVSDLGTVGAMKWLAAAIAPPVAAGSVDTGSKHDVCRDSERFYLQNCLDAIERAEKAEAELKQVNEWRSAALQENMRLSDLWMDRMTRSEARVKELEEAISTDDRVLRASVPERWKDCASPVGAAQSYIAELESMVTNPGVFVSGHPTIVT